MSSLATSSFESATIRSVWANVLTVLTVRVRSFFCPAISKNPRCGVYRTLVSERTGNFMVGFLRAIIFRWISAAEASIAVSTFRFMVLPLLGASVFFFGIALLLRFARVLRSAPLQDILQGDDEVRLRLLG